LFLILKINYTFFFVKDFTMFYLMITIHHARFQNLNIFHLYQRIIYEYNNMYKKNCNDNLKLFIITFRRLRSSVDVLQTRLYNK